MPPGVGHARADAVPQARPRRFHPGRVEAGPFIGYGHRNPAGLVASGGEHGAADPGVSGDVAQRLPGGGAQRLDGRPGQVETVIDVASHVQFGRDLARLAPQRRAQVGEPGPTPGYLPGQCVQGSLGLGHHEAPRQRPVGHADGPQHAQDVVVDRVGRAPLGLLGGYGRVLGGHLPGQVVRVRVGLPRARTQEPCGRGGARDEGERAGRLLDRQDAGIPGPRGQDDQHERDRHHEPARPHRPADRHRYYQHVGVVAEERPPRHGQHPGHQQERPGGRDHQR